MRGLGFDLAFGLTWRSADTAGARLVECGVAGYCKIRKKMR